MINIIRDPCMDCFRKDKKIEEQQAEIERLRAELDRAADALEFYDNKEEAQRARAALEPRIGAPPR